MSTNGLVGFVTGGELRMMDVRYDAYPSRLGRDVLNFVRGVEDWAAVRDTVKDINMVSGNDNVPNEEAIRMNEYPEFRSRVVDTMSWNTVLSAAKFTDCLRYGVMVEHASQPEDSIHVEWAYLIDIDEERLEVYMGYQTEPHESGRFHDTGSVSSTSGKTFYPIKLISAFYFDGLPGTDVFVDMVESKAIRERKALLSSTS